MKASQRVALEMSTKREALNALLGLDEMSDEQRTEMGGLTTRLQELETEARAAIMAEDVPVVTTTTRPGRRKTASCGPWLTAPTSATSLKLRLSIGPPLAPRPNCKPTITLPRT